MPAPGTALTDTGGRQSPARHWLLLRSARVNFPQLLLHEVNIPSGRSSSFPDAAQGSLSSPAGIWPSYLVPDGIHDDRGYRGYSKHAQGESHRAPGAAMHQVTQENPGCYAEHHRRAFGTSVDELLTGILRFFTHVLDRNLQPAGEKQQFPDIAAFTRTRSSATIPPACQLHMP